jgi:hypothetical protein
MVKINFIKIGLRVNTIKYVLMGLKERRAQIYLFLISLNAYTIFLGLRGASLGFRVVDLQSHLNYLQSSLNQIRHLIIYREILPTSIESLYFIPNTNYFDDKGNTLYIISHTIYSIMFGKPLFVAEFNIQSLGLLHTLIYILYIYILKQIYDYNINIGLGRLNSLVAVTLINIWPLIFGHMFVNIRDSLIAIGYTLYVIALLNMIQNFNTRRYNNMMMTIGALICIGTRISFISILIMTFVILFVLTQFKSVTRNKKIIADWSVSFAVAATLCFITNPQLWPDSINTFKKILITSSNFTAWGGDIIAYGYVFDGDRAPWWYQTSYFINQTPSGYIILYTCFLIIMARKINLISNKRIILALHALFLFPFIYFIFFRPTVYSGIRQILFVLPIFVLIISQMYSAIRIQFNKSHIILFTLYLSLIVALDVGRFPLNYVYYNELNLNRSIDLNWDLDYQGVSQEMLQRKHLKLNPKVHPDGFVNELNFETGDFGYDAPGNKEILIKYRDINLPWFENCKKIDSIERNFYSSKVTLAEIRKCENEVRTKNKKYKIERVEMQSETLKIILNSYLQIVDKNIGKSICLSGHFQSIEDTPTYVNVKEFKIRETNKINFMTSANRYSFIENQDSGRNNGLVMQTSIFGNSTSKFLACFDNEKSKIIPDKQYEIYYSTSRIAYFIAEELV